MLDEKNMLENKKRYQRYSIIAIVITLVIVIGVSFAYFASTINNNAQTNVIIGFDGGYEFKTTSSNTAVSVAPDELAMFQGSSDTVAALGNHIIDVDLTALDETGYYCTFDFIWEWNSGSDEYYASAEGAKELTVSSSFGEFQVPNYGSSDNVLFSSSISATGTVPTNKEYNFSLNFYNLANVDQSGHSGKSYNGSIKIDNVECDRNLSGQVLSLEQNIDNYTDYTSSQDSSIYRVVDQNGVRYEGKDPDNYVYFNGNEKWRIIGTFDGAEIGLTEGKKYTKIIRNESIGNYAWDCEDNACDSPSDGENDWMNSTLNKYLNVDYLASINNKNAITSARWHLRGFDSYNTSLTSDVFLKERYTGQAGYLGGTQYSAAVEGDFQVGLMYSSDYFYSVYGGNCDNGTTTTVNNFTNGCAEFSWLSGFNEWLISPAPEDSKLALILIAAGKYTGNGYVDYDYVVSSWIAVRPTLYLEDSVTITGGNGSSSSPYVLDMPAKTLSDTVLAQVSDNDYTSSQDSSIYKIADKVFDSDGTTYEAGIRYQGKDPDNYVTFNGESWRIIGAFDGSVIGKENGKYYVKLVREESLGKFALNDTNKMQWAESSLFNKLNNEYYNNGQYSESFVGAGPAYEQFDFVVNGLSANAKIEKVLWHVGGHVMDQSFSNPGNDAAGWWQVEHNGIPLLDSSVSTVEANVGILSASDFLYALYSADCTDATAISSNASCVNYNWLNKYNKENLSNGLGVGSSSSYTYPYRAIDGQVNTDGIAITVAGYYENRPTLYLASDVEVISGDGSKDNPYVLDSPTLSEMVISKETDSDYTSSTGSGYYRVSYQNGYRYQGTVVDNYVTFNNETWRIIGTFNGEDLGLNDSYYTKIIKDETIGTLTWSNAEAILNGDYYNGTGSYASTGITDDKSRSMIAKVKWYKGASSNTMNSVGEFTYDEKGSLGINNTTNPSVSENYINLMYASDIVGSIYGRNGCGNAPLDALDTSCNGYLWIPVYPQEWTLTPYATSNSAFMFDYGYLGTGAITSSYDVRPTLYLKSDVKVIGGSGTKTDQYILDY